MAKKEQKNYLEFIPMRNPEYNWSEKDDIVTVIVPWKGFYNKMAQKLFHRPEKSHISLDRYGSYVWNQIDGKRNVFEIAELVQLRFGEESNPVYQRLIQFFEILKDHKFITLKEKTDA